MNHDDPDFLAGPGSLDDYGVMLWAFAAVGVFALALVFLAALCAWLR